MAGKNGPTLKPWTDEDEVAWQELHKDDPGWPEPEDRPAPDGPPEPLKIGMVEVGMLAAAHERLAGKLHDERVSQWHAARAEQLRGLDATSLFTLGAPGVLPPSNDMLEQQLLGTLMVNGAPLLTDLRPSDFVDPVHGVIYDAMCQCASAGQPVDVQNMTARLANEPKMEQVGGTAYLGQLVSAACASTPTFDRIHDAAETISELAHARHLLTCMDALRQLVLAHEELINDPDGHRRGGGRSRAHSLAMDLTGIARDVLDRSLGWA